MNKVLKWFKDNEAVIVISIVIFLIIVVIVGLLVGLGFLIDYLVRKSHEKYVLENYKVVPYKKNIPVRYPTYVVSEYLDLEEKNLLSKFREMKNNNKKIKIISKKNEKNNLQLTVLNN